MNTDSLVCKQDASFFMKLIEQLDQLHRRVVFLEEVCQGQLIKLIEMQEEKENRQALNH